jgi:hypothetical protein
MGELDYALESEVECMNNDPNDVAFVRATATIRGRDVVEEYVACKIYPLAASFGFESAPLGTTPHVEGGDCLAIICCGNHREGQSV